MCKDGCEVWVGIQAVARAQAAAARVAGLPLDKVVVHNHLIGGGFGRLSAGLDGQGMPVAWNNRFAGSSIIARWLPPAFNNGLDPDTTEGAIDLVYALPNLHVEYVRVEPPDIPTAFWRSVGPSHNVFVTESFMDELAAAAKQDTVAYRRALLAKSPRAKAVLDLAAEKAGWGQPLPERAGRGVSLTWFWRQSLPTTSFRFHRKASEALGAAGRNPMVLVLSRGNGHLSAGPRIPVPG
jgi:isoquinoline 1-oxidoreductase subunit beta